MYRDTRVGRDGRGPVSELLFKELPAWRSTCRAPADPSAPEFPQMPSADRPATRLATRLAFFVPGFGMAAWAPLVPFAKARLAVDDSVLGLLLLCLGIGSVAAMLLTGTLSSRYGSKPIILV